MLYDLIAEAAIMERREGYPRGKMMEALAIQLMDTPKYVLSDPVARMVNTLAEKRPASILAGLPVCIMPFPKIWVEMKYETVLTTLTGLGIHLHQIDTASNPVNLGYFMEAIEDHKIRVSVAWDHKISDMVRPAWYRTSASFNGMDRQPMIAILNVVFDVSPGIIVTEEDVEREYEWAINAVDKDGWLARFKNKKDAEASASFVKRLNTDINPYTEDYVNMIITGEMPYPGGIDMLQKESMHDIGGEWRRALGILMVMNSKTCVEFADQDMTKLSKARVKKGRLPVSNYRMVNMYLSKVQGNRMATAGMSRADMIKHMVSAHLKVRKTGVFLWSAHIRGKIGEAKIPERVVKPGGGSDIHER